MRTVEGKLTGDGRDVSRGSASANSDEDGMDDSSSSADMEEISGDFEIREKRPCCCCLTAMRFYHVTYVLLFIAYLITVPLWAKWLISAPMPYRNWHEDIDKWPLLGLSQTNLALEEPVPGISMSAVPTDPGACNYTCGESYKGYRSNLMNFEVRMKLNESLPASANISTLYPVLLASEDFDNWILVGDRRHASPEPFFRSHSSESGRVYVHKTDQCMNMPEKNNSFTSQGIYLVGCVTWRSGGQDALSKSKTVTAADLGKYCDSVGGVCGWPCGSRIPATRMEACSADGIIDTKVMGKHIPSATGSKVEVFACAETESELSESCTLSTRPLSVWPCHECQQQLKTEEDGFAEEGGASPMDDGLDWSTNLRRRLAGDEVETVVHERFVSLPQLEVRVYESEVPEGRDLFNTPRAFVFAAHSLDGPWENIYAEADIKNVPVDHKYPKTPIKRGGGDMNSMRLEHLNWLSIESDSCFGKRGPLYLVACAVNQSVYDDPGLWYPMAPRFSPGQVVGPPPFNDRCVAVGGRCGHACVPQADEYLQHCDANGEIPLELLVGEIPMEYNETRAVELFVFALLVGFAVKILMLCPGIFSPYRRAHDYDPDMTESFRYIVAVAALSTADDNKGAMVRNLVGLVACMPPDCRCRYHVVANDEGHRNEMKQCWRLFCKIIASVPNFGGDSYERNVLELTKVWCSETRMMGLPQIGGKTSTLDEKVLDRLSGKSSLKKMLKETRWRRWDTARIAALESAMNALATDLRTDYNKFTQSTPYLDDLEDWSPADTDSLPLRLHYTSRAKPIEDQRNIMVNHAAVGSWYYKVPTNATVEDWLALRTRSKEMVYALPDHDDEAVNVPLRSSHGKAGGLNFVDNYMTVVARRPHNIYDNEMDEAPCLFAIAEAFHQFQPDFMLSCIPCFFTRNGLLDERVSFTQTPPHYPEISTKSDYMDCNNASYFRLTSMLRNCCGGVTSCGTNAMFMIPANDSIWERRLKRVRDQDKKRREHLIEREFFHTSTKIDDTATTIDSVLMGRHSHFVNRKLAFGMAKDPTEFLGVQSRWVEGAVTLALQWLTNTTESDPKARRNRWMISSLIMAFVSFIALMMFLVTDNHNEEKIIEYGWETTGSAQALADPIKDFFFFLENNSDGTKPHYLKLFGNIFDLDVTKTLFRTLVIWITLCVSCFLMLFVTTCLAKGITRCCRCPFPNEMRWWSRLLIAMDILTNFVWFWSAFFWIGFNCYLAWSRVTFHFDNTGMMAFMLVVNVLNLLLLMTNSMRYSIMESVDANEVAALSMDVLWRSNQLFFVSAPLQLFSLASGISEFVKYRFYGQDIGGAVDEEKTTLSVRLVKFWTALVVLCPIVCWVRYFVVAWIYPNSLAACITLTLIALDVLHPCVFLWFGHVNLNPHEVAKMTCFQCLLSCPWWKAQVKSWVLEGAFASFLKYLPLAYFIFMPFLALYNSYFGLTGAFMLVAMGPAH